MSNFTNEQLAVAKDIVSQGLEKAAETLSFFLNEKVSLFQNDDSEIADISKISLQKKQGDLIYFLTTKVIGEMKGVCCLIFSEEEVKHLHKAALPPEILADPAMMAEMGDAIMLEVDNIISASVITQFSNSLKVKIHGGVPGLQKINFEDMATYISEEISKELYLISFKTNFETDNMNFSPEFLWLFDNTFVETIQKYSQIIA
jgi:chemotaxis protein CheY-P-specific phosphatase CheC